MLSLPLKSDACKSSILYILYSVFLLFYVLLLIELLTKTNFLYVHVYVKLNKKMF